MNWYGITESHYAYDITSQIPIWWSFNALSYSLYLNDLCNCRNTLAVIAYATQWHWDQTPDYHDKSGIPTGVDMAASEWIY